MAPTRGTKYSSKRMTQAEFEAKIGKYGYDEIDNNYSGNISKGEWARLFKQLDTNEDGVVDREEWEVMFGPGSFDNWDENGDGAVNYREWCKIYSSKTGKWGEKHFVVTKSGGNSKGSHQNQKTDARHEASQTGAPKSGPSSQAGSRRPSQAGSRRPSQSGSRRPSQSGSRRPSQSGSRRPSQSGAEGEFTTAGQQLPSSSIQQNASNQNVSYRR